MTSAFYRHLRQFSWALEMKFDIDYGCPDNSFEYSCNHAIKSNSVYNYAWNTLSSSIQHYACTVPHLNPLGRWRAHKSGGGLNEVGRKEGAHYDLIKKSICTLKGTEGAKKDDDWLIKAWKWEMRASQEPEEQLQQSRSMDSKSKDLKAFASFRGISNCLIL